MKKAISIILASLLILLSLGTASADLQVHFLDVGQGDCAVILCDGEAMMIDGGPKASAQYVYSYVKYTLRLSCLNYIVSTHPHSDHVGGLSAVLNALPVDLLLTSVLEWDSNAFRSMLNYAELQGTPLAVPKEGDVLQLGGATVTVLHCWQEAVGLGRTNDASIVLRIDYGKTSFLFTGDAEDWSEYMMIDAGVDLKADVLKVSHHGSSTATTKEFLQAVNPQYAVISAGKNNEYGHPHNIVLNRLDEAHCMVLRTDRMGTVAMQSDGAAIRILPLSS